MPVGTLRKWISKFNQKHEVGGPAALLPVDLPAQSWSPVQRLLALNQTHAMSETQLHAWCREKGLFAHQLKAWGEAFCRDISDLPTEVRGMFFKLYLLVDLFSRRIVGWQVYDCESAERASELLLDICKRCGMTVNQLTVYSDNGSPMKGETMLATMQRFGVAGSRSRPAVSNDNPTRKPCSGR
jgi:transposase InsO family protein